MTIVFISTDVGLAEEHFVGTIGLASRYMRALIQINADSKWTCQIQIASNIVNCKSRFTSVLRVAFELAVLTQCDFYCVSVRTICRHPLPVHVLIVFSNLELMQLLCNAEKLMQI